jgi:Lrp/AsnC family transcriptional regulator, leucine-responsive regulatory protein
LHLAAQSAHGVQLCRVVVLAGEDRRLDAAPGCRTGNSLAEIAARRGNDMRRFFPSEAISASVPRPLKERIGFSVSIFSTRLQPNAASRAACRTTGEPRKIGSIRARTRAISLSVIGAMALSRRLACPAAIVACGNAARRRDHRVCRLFVAQSRMSTRVSMNKRPIPPLDSIDRYLLDILQRDARAKLETLATEVGLSASAVQRRVARLREAGVIAGECVVLDPKAASSPVTVIVELMLERERPSMIDGLRRWLVAAQEVQSAWGVTGETDFVLIVTAADLDSYERFARRMMEENEVIREFRTSIALNRLKHSLFVPVRDGRETEN